MKRKAIILAGGTGSRLHPLTVATNKHLLPVYDKPMIYYPLSTMILGGFSEFVLISSAAWLPRFRELLGDGSQWGIDIRYRAQAEPRGIAQCFQIARADIDGCRTGLILGDNIFYGSGLPQRIEAATALPGAVIFGYPVNAVQEYGIVELDGAGKPLRLVEKPTQSASNLAVPGLYLYDDDVAAMADRLAPSARGELEITDLNSLYLRENRLNVLELGRGVAWLDGGTHEDLFEAAQFVRVMEQRTGLKIACPEEAAYRKGLISRAHLERLVERMNGTPYRIYLERQVLGT